MQELTIIGSNISVLRSEARLSVEEFSEASGLSVERIVSLEKGLSKPLTKELMVICPILRISEEDLLERDIKAEREDAKRRMKNSSSRKNYDWYYGKKSTKVFYLLALILIPLTFIISYFGIFSFISEDMFKNATEGEEQVVLNIKVYRFIYSYIFTCITGAVFMIISTIKRFGRLFRFWMIPLFIFSSGLIYLGIAILLIPYYGYCFYKLVFKHGKNR